MSAVAVSIGGASNASSLQPQKYKDPLDFIRDFVLNSKDPMMALNLVMIGVIKQAQKIDSVRPEAFEPVDGDTRPREEQLSEFETYKMLARDFLDKLDKEYPSDQHMDQSPK